MRLKIGKKLETASLNSKFTGSKKNSELWPVHLRKNLKPIVVKKYEPIKVYPPTISRALHVI